MTVCMNFIITKSFIVRNIYLLLKSAQDKNCSQMFKILPNLNVKFTGLFPITDGTHPEIVENYDRDSFTTLDASGCFINANFKTLVIIHD